VRGSRRRTIAFLALVASTAVSILAVAQPRKAPPAKPPVTAPAKKPAGKPAPSADVDANAPMSTKEEKPQPVAKDKDAGAGGAVVESKTLDGGAKVFRFGEVEVEGRLKSPQIVYFLRRVRAEFAAGDLGHRSFSRELSDTRNDPQF
jgi:hypothetical protein